MARFLLCHRHDPAECRFAFAAWRGVDSPLRHLLAIGGCAHGDHRMWWDVEATDADAALAQLPEFVAQRSEAVPVSPVPIP